MTHLNALQPTPSASFDDPLAILSGCHDRILLFCTQLERLGDYLMNNRCDQDAIESARKIHRYFSTAGRYHHQDEEVDLFPVLIANDPSLVDLTDALQATHRELDNIWHRLDTVLLSLDNADYSRLQHDITQFIGLNRDHVTLENNELLPRAKSLLKHDELERLGESMAQRRGVDYHTNTRS
ncbi:MAG: hemerythrin domain-containing protein [Gammaproteobacteria bacterium]|nr:hemerythrin domain-containing protein [Gammaproteobacteria bacterium]